MVTKWPQGLDHLESRRCLGGLVTAVTCTTSEEGILIDVLCGAVIAALTAAKAIIRLTKNWSWVSLACFSARNNLNISWNLKSSCLRVYHSEEAHMVPCDWIVVDAQINWYHRL